MKDQKLEGLLASTGTWVTLAEWDSSSAEYDAAGWIDDHGKYLGFGPVSLPTSGAVDLRKFAAIRAA